MQATCSSSCARALGCLMRSREKQTTFILYRPRLSTFPQSLQTTSLKQLSHGLSGGRVGEGNRREPVSQPPLGSNVQRESGRGRRCGVFVRDTLRITARRNAEPIEIMVG